MNPDDPYCYPGTTVLRNKLRIHDAGKLATAEDRRAGMRYAILAHDLPKPPFTFDTLRDIHRTLLQDVYSWAGKPRTTRLGKPEFDRPLSRITWFNEPNQIESQGKAIFDRLAAANYLTGLNRRNFAAEAADLLQALNQLHPFREGNGRAQRLLVAAVADNAGHPATFDVITRERMVATSVAAAHGDASGFVRLLEDAIDPQRASALRKAIGDIRKHSSMDWNNVYIATTQAGETYRGVLAGKAGQDFMMRVDAKPQAWIAIGDVRDLPRGVAEGEKIAITASQFIRTLPPTALPDIVRKALNVGPHENATTTPMLDLEKLRAFETRPSNERGAAAGTPQPDNQRKRSGPDPGF